MTPPGAPPLIAAVIERFLRLHLGVNLDRPQTIRHFRDALHRLVRWLAVEHPDVVSLDELHRSHAEGFLRWLGSQNSTRTGAPLALTTRRSVITLLARFVHETAAWGWDDVPGRVLFVRGDIPKTPRTLPRFIPDHELAALMAAVDQLEDPYQRAALIVARWSGARRDEIRRLSLDCLDSYPDGHQRLRIPVGKGHAERSIPLHPEAADALRSLITLARAQDARDRYAPAPGARSGTCSSSAESCCSTRSCSSTPSTSLARRRVSSTRPVGRRSTRTGSGTPSAPGSPRAAHACRRSWPSWGTRRRRCR